MFCYNTAILSEIEIALPQKGPAGNGRLGKEYYA